MKSETVLVVGANGFVGYYLVKRLLECKYGVIAIDCSDDHMNEFICRNNFLCFKANLLEEYLPNIEKKIDVIVNLASIGHGTLLSKKKEVNFEPIYVNVKLTEELLKYAIEKKIDQFIQMSSASVYGNCVEPQNEEMRLELNSPYAISKAAMESIGNIYSKLYQINVISYRAFNIYGYNRFAQKYHSNLIHNLVMYSRNEKNAIIYGNPKAKRDYVYVEDVVDGIIFAIEKRMESGIYNLGTGAAYSVNDLWEDICRVTGKNSKLLSLERNYFNVPIYSQADMLKTNREGFNCKTTIHEGILIINELCKTGERSF